MQFNFYKYQGTGNDFIIADNRNNQYQLTNQQIAALCNRKFGIGADGLMLLQAQSTAHFEMKYYNADGNESTMCGNGGRCLVKFAASLGILEQVYHFTAIDGLHQAKMDENGWVHLQMIDVNKVIKGNEYTVVNTGSPHYVSVVNDVKSYAVFAQGKQIRNSQQFYKEGINVNFVEEETGKGIYVRTYERGVEDETLSCGTGVTAAALTYTQHAIGSHCVAVTTLGGNLQVSFEKLNEQTFKNIWLSGPATFVFQGIIEL